jgi:hypothetical protein
MKTSLPSFEIRYGNNHVTISNDYVKLLRYVYYSSIIIIKNCDITFYRNIVDTNTCHHKLIIVVRQNNNYQKYPTMVILPPLLEVATFLVLKM